MSGLRRFSKVLAGPASRLAGMARTPFALMQQSPANSRVVQNFLEHTFSLAHIMPLDQPLLLVWLSAMIRSEVNLYDE
jgi:hypothetical protein